MLNEWSDRLPRDEARALWKEAATREIARRMAVIEAEIRSAISSSCAAPAGFFEAMRLFTKLREKLFPELPADPAWKMLIELARAEEEGRECTLKDLCYGANVPLTTVLRYLSTMEIHGIITRSAVPGDRRRINIKLTAEGRWRLDAIQEKWRISVPLMTATPAAFLAGALFWSWPFM